MHSDSTLRTDSVATLATSAPAHWNLALALCVLLLTGVSCTDETNSESTEIVVEQIQAPTHLRTQTLTLENTSFNGQRGAGFGDLYEATALGGENAAKNAERIDFRHQYRGRDIGNRRSFENMTTKKRWDRLGLFTDVTPTESLISSTSLDEATFDEIGNATELVASFEFQTLLDDTTDRYRRAYLSNEEDEPLATVFAFVDKKGRRGLFKVLKAETAPIGTVAEGTITIEIKIEDPGSEGEASP
jgi:hypothetical protein